MEVILLLVVGLQAEKVCARDDGIAAIARAAASFLVYCIVRCFDEE
jgi:hypothetical protein